LEFLNTKIISLILNELWIFFLIAHFKLTVLIFPSSFWSSIVNIISESVTLVILANFQPKLGSNFFSLIEGMFSFAIHDLSNGLLTIGRDRYGIKPLYYSINKKELYFS
jgi:hypothetical protein